MKSVGQQRVSLPSVEARPAAVRYGHPIEVVPCRALEVARLETGRNSCEPGTQIGQLAPVRGLIIQQIEKRRLMNRNAAQELGVRGGQAQ